MRADGRQRDDELRRSSSSRTGSSWRTAPSSTRRERHACSARRWSRRRARWLYRSGPRLDDRRVLAPAGLDRRARRTRGGEGQAGRPHGRDPAADRPRAPLGLRLRGARRADALARLRRAPGRRRHALRGDLRRLRRRLASARPLRPAKALKGQIAAVSVGVVDGRALLDLDYAEDSSAETDMNVVMTADGRVVEVQATAEREPFTRDELDGLLDLAAGGSRRSSGAGRGGRGRACLSSRQPRRCCGCSSPAALGGAIGLERELRDHEAGFRTHLLVSLGACVFTLVSAYAWTDWTFSTPSRRLRPDAHRGADRDRGRLPRRRRDHRPRHLRPRADDGGDPVDRRRDRDGRGHRLTTSGSAPRCSSWSRSAPCGCSRGGSSHGCGRRRRSS